MSSTPITKASKPSYNTIQAMLMQQSSIQQDCVEFIDPVKPTHAANKNYVDRLGVSNPMKEPLDMSSHQIINLADPESPASATPRRYVDSLVFPQSANHHIFSGADFWLGLVLDFSESILHTVVIAEFEGQDECLSLKFKPPAGYCQAMVRIRNTSYYPLNVSLFSEVLVSDEVMDSAHYTSSGCVLADSLSLTVLVMHVGLNDGGNPFYYLTDVKKFSHNI